ncbi:MAG: helix-turn-helix transcriptional regulator [Coriobacteriales bacterium]|nr:helix-turn-helix transcriptional regulator [Coriobacteriales bacterium]
MNNLKEDVYQEAFRLWNFKPIIDFHKYSPSGNLYVFDNEMGHGEYWVHFNRNLFAANVYEMQFNQPGKMCYRHAEHISICLYESSEGLFAEGYYAEPGAVSVYIAQEGQEYVGHFDAGAHVKASSITISPDYYRDYLQQRFGSIPDIRRAFAKVDGKKDFPELIMLFKRMQKYRGDGIAADLFYEGIVAEAIGLVIKRANDIDGANKGMLLSSEDKHALDGLETYVWNHLDEDLTVECLARISCMGLTKFKESFKARYGCTPAAYIQNQRVIKAKSLLEQTDFSIATIASAVGYGKPSAFSKAFKRITGVLPGAYKERMLREGSSYAAV